MTELLYLKDSYLQDFEASVVSIEGRNVILDKTAFYPEGGGLPDDRGKIVKLPDGENFQVMMVKKLGQQILHEVDVNGLKVGDKVRGWIDWKRRYKMMKMHTATHVLAAVIHTEIGALITGNQLKLDGAHIDFNGPEVKDRYKEFEQKVNDILARNLSVETKFMPYKEAMKIPSVIKLANVLPPSIPELRIVSIGDIDIQADGGPHVKNTSECGKIEITSFENKGKDRKRIYFVLTQAKQSSARPRKTGGFSPA
jgi:misacylated tRNA(Ala) deacylase